MASDSIQHAILLLFRKNGRCDSLSLSPDETGAIVDRWLSQCGDKRRNEMTRRLDELGPNPDPKDVEAATRLVQQILLEESGDSPHFDLNADTRELSLVDDEKPTVGIWTPTVIENSVRTTGVVRQISADQGHDNLRGSHVQRELAHRDQLMSSIAHDLRTPLTAIREFTHLLDHEHAGELNPQQRRYVSIIERRCHEAARMVDDLLDAARIQSGRIHPHREPSSLADVVRDVCESLEPTIQHKGVEVLNVIPDEFPPVFADRDMLGRILTNLVSNALKVSEQGQKIRITAERSSLSMVRVTVTDEGAGIAPEDLRRIFRRFETNSTSGDHGVGLGLSIVRQLVRLHGGRVSVESIPSHGSKFQFTLPQFLPSALIRKHVRTESTQSSVSLQGWEFRISDKYEAIHRLISASSAASDLVMPESSKKRVLLIRDREPEALFSKINRQVVSCGVEVPAVRRLSREELLAWPSNDASGPSVDGSYRQVS